MALLDVAQSYIFATLLRFLGLCLVGAFWGPFGVFCVASWALLGSPGLSWVRLGSPGAAGGLESRLWESNPCMSPFVVMSPTAPGEIRKNMANFGARFGHAVAAH